MNALGKIGAALLLLPFIGCGWGGGKAPESRSPAVTARENDKGTSGAHELCIRLVSSGDDSPIVGVSLGIAVLDAEQLPNLHLASASLRGAIENTTLVTNLQGLAGPFALDPSHPCYLFSTASDWFIAGSDWKVPDALPIDGVLEVKLCKGMEIRGLVTDAAGLPLQGARVVAFTGVNAFAEGIAGFVMRKMSAEGHQSESIGDPCTPQLGSPAQVQWTSSQVDGRFRLAGLPRCQAALVAIWAKDCTPVELSVPLGDEPSVDIPVQRLSPASDLIVILRSDRDLGSREIDVECILVEGHDFVGMLSGRGKCRLGTPIRFVGLSGLTTGLRVKVQGESVSRVAVSGTNVVGDRVISVDV